MCVYTYIFLNFLGEENWRDIWTKEEMENYRNNINLQLPPLSNTANLAANPGDLPLVPSSNNAIADDPLFIPPSNDAVNNQTLTLHSTANPTSDNARALLIPSSNTDNPGALPLTSTVSPTDNEYQYDDEDTSSIESTYEYANDSSDYEDENMTSIENLHNDNNQAKELVSDIIMTNLPPSSPGKGELKKKNSELDEKLKNSTPERSELEKKISELEENLKNQKKLTLYYKQKSKCKLCLLFAKRLKFEKGERAKKSYREAVYGEFTKHLLEKH